MARGNKDGGFGFVGENGIGVGFGAFEAKTIFDVIGAEGGGVDDGAEGNFGDEAREKHGAREISGPDHIKTLYARFSFWRGLGNFIGRLCRRSWFRFV